MQDIDIFRNVLAIIVFGVAGVLDKKTRKIPNWLLYSPIGLVIGQWMFLTPNPLHLGLSIIACAAAFMLWAFKVYGGADAKGLMLISLLYPYPVFNAPGWLLIIFGSLVVFASIVTLETLAAMVYRAKYDATKISIPFFASISISISIITALQATLLR